MRVDQYLVQYGHARSRESARKSIESGLVTVDGRLVKKSSEKIDETLYHSISYRNSLPYVGRGGLKLEAALDSFDIDPTGKICLDIGASTGGFTDCLLKRGASHVYAIDSGHGQLAPELLADSRVTSLEGINARFLTLDTIGEKADIIVMDVSFISQTLILPRFVALLKDDGVAITLIKPQFECGREAIGKCGIVKKPEYRIAAVRKVITAAADNGLYAVSLIRSPIEGGDGNVEFLSFFDRSEKQSAETVLGGVDYR
ncbi:MAG: TlyA family RNA methyltransferase [Eubacteriales bacterium]